MRNFDNSPGNTESSVSFRGREVSEVECEDREDGNYEVDVYGCGEDVVERRIPQGLGDLSPEALNYIEELESELATIEKVGTFSISIAYKLLLC